MQPTTFLVLGATGGTGRHFTAKALKDGHQVRALVRTPGKLVPHDMLDIREGSITDPIDLDALVNGVDQIVVMLGDKQAQQQAKVNTAFIQRLVPAMRRQRVKRILYQAGGLSRPYGGRLTLPLWIIRNTLARSFIGQHRDNEAVMEYLATVGSDLDWNVHRAGIFSDGPSKGVLQRSEKTFSVATFRDRSDYNYHLLNDTSAAHTADFSTYSPPS
jgi:putative NADH-flavin reductase